MNVKINQIKVENSNLLFLAQYRERLTSQDTANAHNCLAGFASSAVHPAVQSTNLINFVFVLGWY